MKKTIKLILIYTVLFGVLAAGIFVLFILAHKSFIQYGDGYKQGYFWVVEVRQQLQDLAAEKGFHFWSWSNGLGMNAPLGYIIDPFMIIAALFPPGAIELGYTVSNLLKLYFGGLVFLIFCSYVNLDGYKCVIGSLCYAFSAWFIEVALCQSSLLMNAYRTVCGMGVQKKKSRFLYSCSCILHDEDLLLLIHVCHCHHSLHFASLFRIQ